ncbi:DUF6211 family protein [Streptomyces sp. NRRL F-525]|uniref:DUF6211 family protein n=1 Tax=Streptomyces sp. NRRL F-525 TaxID=1463861 RepID=UPI0005265CAE|nr:DUF6211 family protein [Streptomyces sp. NRRL F-525]
MVDPQHPPAGTRDPQPYDFVRLHPGNRLGIAPEVLLTVADVVDNAPGVLEVHHQTDHPDYMDWAGAVTADDIATVVRITGATAHSWSPRP